MSMMKTNDKEFMVELVRVEGDRLPFAEVEMMCKDGVKKGVMIIDSCSINNLLYAEFVKELPEENLNTGYGLEVYGLANASTKMELIKVDFSMGGDMFHTEAAIDGNSEGGMVGDLPILGILGHEFLMQHHLVLDFSDFTIHTSCVDHSNFCIGDGSFFFPMQLGKDIYGVPIILICCGNDSIVTLPDTGATDNIVTAKALKRAGVDYANSGSSLTISGVVSTENVVVADIDFSLHSLADNADGYLTIPQHEQFAISHEKCILKAGIISANPEENPDVEAILGCPFLSKLGVVMDFGAMIMYKRK